MTKSRNSEPSKRRVGRKARKAAVEDAAHS